MSVLKYLTLAQLNMVYPLGNSVNHVSFPFGTFQADMP